MIKKKDPHSCKDYLVQGPIRLFARVVDHGCADALGITPLHTAAFNGKIRKVRELLKGIDVNITDKYGWTPLHDAAIQGHTKIVKLLLAAGANVNAQDNEDLYTPLHDAALMSYYEIMVLLLAVGADMTLRDRWNGTALDLVRKKNLACENTAPKV